MFLSALKYQQKISKGKNVSENSFSFFRRWVYIFISVFISKFSLGKNYKQCCINCSSILTSSTSLSFVFFNIYVRGNEIWVYIASENESDSGWNEVGNQGNCEELEHERTITAIVYCQQPYRENEAWSKALQKQKICYSLAWKIKCTLSKQNIPQNI